MEWGQHTGTSQGQGDSGDRNWTEAGTWYLGGGLSWTLSVALLRAGDRDRRSPPVCGAGAGAGGGEGVLCADPVYEVISPAHQLLRAFGDVLALLALLSS
jgi:hypothetical protein